MKVGVEKGSMDELPRCELGDTTLGQYVHSPYAAISEAFQHVGINHDSVVVDLGCGDGRACIVAVKQFGAFGIGVDIDEELIHAKFLPKVAELKLPADRIVGVAGDACRPNDLRELDGLRPTHIYLYILPHCLHLLVPALQQLWERNHDVVIISAFALPPPNVPTEVFEAPSCNTLSFKIYHGRPMGPDDGATGATTV